MSGGPPTLDPEAIAELRRLAADNPGFLAQLVSIFEANAPARLAGVRDAIARGDAAAVESIAHTLKSNCSMLGALRMADYCQQVETLAGRRAFDEAAALWDRAAGEFERVRAAVRALGPLSSIPD